MTVSELIDHLKHVDPNYRVVVGIGSDYREIDYFETDYTSELCSLWLEGE